MPLTDENGKTGAGDLQLGLYLLAETKVPEYVTETVDPWFAALPFTDPEGERWLYDLTCYPKNQTGKPTLEKFVQNAGENVDGTDKNTKDFAETATASEGDVLNYLLVSKMPHIQSQATYLTQYSFRDTLSEGLEYNRDAKIAFYTSARRPGKMICPRQWKSGGQFPDPGILRAGLSGVKDGRRSGKRPDPAACGDFRKRSGKNQPGEERLLDGGVLYRDRQRGCDAVLGDEGNPNDAELTWRRTSDSYYDTLEDSCVVYTYGLQLNKLFSDGEGDPQKAGFVLYNSTDGYYLQAGHTGTIDGRKVYYITGKTAEKEDAACFTPAADGAFWILGLEADTYLLTEIHTDSGYQILQEPVEISIQSTEGMGENRIPASVTVDGVKAKLEEFVLTDESYIVHDQDFASGIVQTVQQQGEIRSENAQAVLEITNHRKFLLPQTGGAGSYLITIAGLAVAAAGVFAAEKAFAKRRKQDGNA